jgi:hypothetical protein
LETPENELPSIDPAGWVKQRNYAHQNYQAVLNHFLEERVNSVNWLLSLSDPPWQNKYLHPKFGAMSAKMFFCNWLAHDHLHIRQIVKLRHDYLKHISGESLNYAGDW